MLAGRQAGVDRDSPGCFWLTRFASLLGACDAKTPIAAMETEVGRLQGPSTRARLHVHEREGPWHSEGGSDARRARSHQLPARAVCDCCVYGRLFPSCAPCRRAVTAPSGQPMQILASSHTGTTTQQGFPRIQNLQAKNLNLRAVIRLRLH